MFKLVDETRQSAIIKVIGVGGGGCNALNYMVENTIEGVEFIAANTDMQALRESRAETILQLGESATTGLGAGGNPEYGREAALETREAIANALGNADMVFVTAGMGGGTGTGAAPVITEIARETGSLTVAVTTRPFPFEGISRMQAAEQGIKKLREHADSLITIPNGKLLTVLGKETPLIEAFNQANQVLHNAVQGIAELITRTGMINLDFADVKTVMSEMGAAMMGSGSCSGENRAYEAVHAAISNPLLEDIGAVHAKGLLVNITASDSLSIAEYEEISQCVSELTVADARRIIGTVIDNKMGDELRVTMVATGLQTAESESLDSAAKTARLRAAGDEERSPEPAGDASLQADHPASEDADSDNAEEREKDKNAYTHYDQPAVSRLGVKVLSGAAEPKPGEKDKAYNDYLDIPAFLRKQVD